MRVITIACLKDNYAYLLADRDGNAVVIDPSEASPVLQVLEREQLTLRAIWLTHHHWDHVGGIDGLLERFAAIDVVGSRYDAAHARIGKQTRTVGDGDTLSFGGLTASIVEVPGHTLGAVAYQIGEALFTGDTLFTGGCGRLFEGTPSQMQASLARLRQLKPSLQVYPGHEYTVSNLMFARSVEPHNDATRERLEQAQAARARAEFTVPSRLSHELSTNVFLRWDAPEVITFAGVGDDPSAVFAAVRKAKDTF